MLATHSQSSLGFIFRIRMTLSGTIFRDKIFPLGCFVRNRCRALISSGSATMNWRRQPLSSSQNCHPPELSIQWSYQLVYAYNVRWMLRNFDNFTGQCIPSTHYGHALDHNLHHCEPSPLRLLAEVYYCCSLRSTLSSKMSERSCRVSRKTGRPWHD